MAIDSFNEIYCRLVELVYQDDIGSQSYYLSVIAEQRNVSLDYLLQRRIMFIPNNEYIRHYIGAEGDHYAYELYREDTCIWTLYAIIPVTDLAGSVVGLTGWDARNKYLEVSEGQVGLQMYRTSSKAVFQKDKYFLADTDLLRETFPSRTVFITDGVFDSIALNYRGIPALALLGSTFSREVLYFLRWYSKVYVCADNDPAGGKLYNRLRGSLPNVYRVFQNKTKDIEELLRGDPPDGPITKQLLQPLYSDKGSDIYLRV